jgi:hypothetical protein
MAQTVDKIPPGPKLVNVTVSFSKLALDESQITYLPK